MIEKCQEESRELRHCAAYGHTPDGDTHAYTSQSDSRLMQSVELNEWARKYRHFHYVPEKLFRDWNLSFAEND